jgi:hypothetical protein
MGQAIATLAHGHGKTMAAKLVRHATFVTFALREN